MLEYDHKPKFHMFLKGMKLTFITLSLLLLIILATQHLLSIWYWEHMQLHVSLQIIGALMTFILPIFMMVLKKLKRPEPSQLWIGCALLCMGSLDGLHAVMFTAERFVWLQSITNGLGGGLFALVLLPKSFISRCCQTHGFFITMMLIGTGIGLLLLSFPAFLEIRELNNTFNIINTISYIGFFLAAWHFLRTPSLSPPHVSQLLFASHCFLLGLGSVLFQLAHLWDVWDAMWGFWHLLRLSAYFILLYYSIFSLKQVFAQLVTSQQRLHIITEFAPVGIFYTDVYGRNRSLNQKTSRLTGLTAEEAIGKGWIKAVHPDDRKNVLTQWHHSIENNQMFKSQLRLQHADGTTLWVTAEVVAELTPSGEILGYIGTLTEINETKHTETQSSWHHHRLEEMVEQRTHQLTLANQKLQREIAESRKIEVALHERETRFANILNMIPHAIITTDETQHIIFVNQQAEHIFGYTIESIIGMPLEMLLPDRFKSLHRQHIDDFKHGLSLSQDFWKEIKIIGQRKDGSEFSAEVSISKLTLQSGTLLTAILCSVSEC